MRYLLTFVGVMTLICFWAFYLYCTSMIEAHAPYAEHSLTLIGRYGQDTHFVCVGEEPDEWVCRRIEK